MSNTDAPQRQRKVSPATLIAVGGGLVLVLVLAFGIFGNLVAGLDLTSGGSNAAGAEVEKTNKPKPTPEPTPTPTDEPDKCPAQFVQVEVDRVNSTDTDPRYEGEVRPIANSLFLTPEAKDQKIHEVDLKLAGSNAQTLANWAEAAGMPIDSNDWRKLVEGGKVVNGVCLTREGQDVYIGFKAITEQKGVSIDIVDTAPADGTNSGINGDESVVAGEPGLTGDTSSVVYTFPDGSKLIRMIRCGNVIWIRVPPPHLRPGKTDNEEPPTGTGGDCVDCAEAKIGSQSSNANEAVNEWVQDTSGGGHVVNNNDGATDAQGYQADPRADAAAAEAAAAAAAKAAAEAAAREQAEADAEAQESGAGTVNENQEKTESTTNPWE